MASQTALEALVKNMTLQQLADQTGRSVNEIVGWAMGASPVSAGKAAPKSLAKAAGTVEVSKAADRAVYDKAVLELLTSNDAPTSAAEVRAQLGGTPVQARASLNRLIEQKVVGYEGRARAMRYFVK